MPPAGQQFVDAIITEIVDPIVAVLFAIAAVVFFYGLVEFLYRVEDPGAQKIGKQHMIWGVIGMFIMVSAFSILKLFTNSFGIQIP